MTYMINPTMCAGGQSTECCGNVECPWGFYRRYLGSNRGNIKHLVRSLLQAVRTVSHITATISMLAPTAVYLRLSHLKAGAVYFAP